MCWFIMVIHASRSASNVKFYVTVYCYNKNGARMVGATLSEDFLVFYLSFSAALRQGRRPHDPT